MRTECKQARFEFHQLSQRKVKARFDGGKITSDAGVLLLQDDPLRTDPMLAVAVNKADPLGERRRQAGDRGKVLAGRCTLNRLELTAHSLRNRAWRSNHLEPLC